LNRHCIHWYSIRNTGYKTRKEHQCETPECKD